MSKAKQPPKEIDLSEVNPYVLKLWKFGHFDNPQMKESHNVTEKDLPKLKLEDKAVQEAVISYQSFFSDLIDEQSQMINGRPAIADGDIGPATDAALGMPRCGLPDYMAIEEANWPDSCRNQISVSYRFQRIAAAVASISWPKALQSWVDRLELQFELKETFSNTTRIWATDGSLSGSVLAWSMLAQNNCNARLEQRYNTGVSWSPSYLQATICHEVGHALGCGHLSTRSAIMFPSITNLVLPGEPDINEMVRLGYKKRTTPIPPPDGPPPDGGPGTGTFTTPDGKKYLLIGIPA